MTAWTERTGSIGGSKVIEFHPIADVFPLMEGEEFAELVQSIKENGQRDAIVTFNELILDGRNRYRACQEAGVEPIVEEYGGDDPLGYVSHKRISPH
jgi:ParB-like chromosome segregation protein Spo0J